MPLNPLAPRLRVVNSSNDVAKVELVIEPGDELEVSVEVAAQLAHARAPLTPVKPAAKAVKATKAAKAVKAP